ncbi:transposase [Orenia marismortui]|uniref:transposase n=1 Tax=Orenia marismortui TaxID=46469 RepID=UPI000372AF7D|nr:transposase [Orenia marismortui]
MIRLRQRKSTRLKDYDYSQDGYYFITTCTKNREEVFWGRKNNRIILSLYGEIVMKQWLWLQEQYSYVELDEFIVMPDHFHGILIINNVGNGRDHSLQKNKSLSGLIGAFKTRSSKFIHITGYSGFQWQGSFYDRIIRNEGELDRIRKYIVNNPLNLTLDIDTQLKLSK